MKDSKWLLKLLLGLVFGLLLTAVFNIWMDPYCIFENNHAYNQRQDFMIEAYAKSFYLKKHVQEYDEFMIGGSNVSEMDVTKFPDRKIFNYGISGHSYLDISNTLSLLYSSSSHIKRVYICFNFYQYLGTAPRFIDFPGFFENLESESFKLRSVIGLDQLSLSVKNLINNFRPQIEGYYLDRNFVAKADLQETKVYNSKSLLSRGIAKSEFDKSLKNIELKEGIEYVIFTSPMHEKRLRLYMQNIPDEYNDWLRSLVGKFGKVYHFAYLNPNVTEASHNFFSGNHFYPQLGDKMLEFLLKPEAQKDANTGIILDKSNLESFLTAESAKFK